MDSQPITIALMPPPNCRIAEREGLYRVFLFRYFRLKFDSVDYNRDFASDLVPPFYVFKKQKSKRQTFCLKIKERKGQLK